jgi:nucleotide-binding universal stress UspA family protein
MAQKILIALDSSEGAWRAVEYVAKAFGDTQAVQVMLLHVLAGLPPAFWDDGHILEEKERESRQRLKANWQKEQEKKWLNLVKKANACLTTAGVPEDAVVNKFKPKYFDVAEDVLREADTGNFDTIVMGKSLLLGSVTHKVVQNAKGRAVTIVG